MSVERKNTVNSITMKSDSERDRGAPELTMSRTGDSNLPLDIAWHHEQHVRAFSRAEIVAMRDFLDSLLF